MNAKAFKGLERLKKNLARYFQVNPRTKLFAMDVRNEDSFKTHKN